MKIITTISTAMISACAISGVMIHGAHLDQIATSSPLTHVSQSNDSGNHSGANIDSSAHPHAEFQASTLFRYLEHNAANSSPIDRSRQKRATAKSPTLRGRHAFDNTFLPIIS